jgi:hypothetical protein
LINGSNVYLVDASDSGNSTIASGLTLQAFASCDAGDFVLNGGFDVIGVFLELLLILMIILINQFFLLILRLGDGLLL